jgi:hypothetical protein
VYLVHEALNHGDGVGAAGLRVDGLLHDDGGDVAELAGELRLPLLARDLELPFLKNLAVQTKDHQFSQQHHSDSNHLVNVTTGGLDRQITSM